MRFCRHEHYIVIDDIMSPKWSTDEVLINTNKVNSRIEHYLIRFTDKSPRERFGWFYLAGKHIRGSRTQLNGRGTMYVVSMKKRQPFAPIKDCNCMQAEFAYDK